MGDRWYLQQLGKTGHPNNKRTVGMGKKRRLKKDAIADLAEVIDCSPDTYIENIEKLTIKQIDGIRKLIEGLQ